MFPLPHHHGEGQAMETLQAHLGQTDRFQSAAEIYKLLSDPTRLRIFWLLCHCEECVVNLSALLDMSSPAVAHHLRALKEAGLLVSRREGKEVCYRAADTQEVRLLHQMTERLLDVICPEPDPHPHSQEPRQELEIVRAIHDRLLHHMDQRFTIEELSREYHMNPTTLKAAFKEVYGDSLAAHIKEHRMEQAARLLRTTDLSVAAIAQAVGYDSQSKFTAAFKTFFQVLPRDYRKHTI